MHASPEKVPLNKESSSSPTNKQTSVIINNDDPSTALTTRQILIAAGIIALLLLFALIGQPNAFSSNSQSSCTTTITNPLNLDLDASNNDNKQTVDIPTTTAGPQKKKKNKVRKVTKAPPPEEEEQDDEKRGLKYKPQIRYEPSPFDLDPEFMLHQNETPLTLIDKGLAKAPRLPEDWDGGYGWVFVKYHPSPFEATYRVESKKVERNPGYPLCALTARNFSQELNAYIRELPRMAPDNGGTKICKKKGEFPAEPMQFDDKIFSRFEYEYRCTREPCRTKPPADAPALGSRKFTYIEPLVAILRHPLVCTNQHYLVNKNYQLVDPWFVHTSRSTIAPEPKVLYLDGGASLWASGAGGPSQNWFHRLYESMCLSFTDWFMWEYAVHHPKKVFAPLPGRVKGSYRWFNTPLETAPESWDNPINHLLVSARKEDIVIFKIDFDSPLIEKALLDLIVKHSQVSELIDELYFEYHVRQDILSRHWGTGNHNVYTSDSITLFTQLRERGIRAHSWV